MKWLCILLLAANALFVGWRVNERLYGSAPNAEEESTVPPLPADAPALTLLSESSESPTPLDGATPEPPVTGAATPTGPSEDADAAAAAVAAAAAADGDSNVAAAEPSAPPPAAVPTPVAEPAAAPPPDDTSPVVPVPAESPQGQIAELAGPNPPAAPDTAASPPAGTTAETTPAQAGTEGSQSAPPASPATATVEPKDAQPADETAAADAPAKPVLLCATIGPFATRDAQRAAERRLTARVERIDGRSQVAREAKMFTVFLEATGTEAEAEKRLDDLKSKGITDYLLIRRGEMRNAIQVGTFRSQESVTKRLAELERSGYKAVVVPKSEAGAEKYWLDVVYDKEKQTLRSLKSLAGGVRAIRADCPR